MQKVSINPSNLFNVRLSSTKDEQSCFARFLGGPLEILNLHI